EAPATAPAKDGRPAARTGHGEPQPFDEVFRGRRIQGGPADLGQHGGNQRGTRSGTGAHGQEEHDQGQHGDGGHGGGYSVRIDGAELHVMRNADGTWISVVNHYETFPTPRAVARAAVLELRGAQLEPMF
ncbi:apotyrosinase chaperone MelC1, partial [Streptomyces sparsus]